MFTQPLDPDDPIPTELRAVIALYSNELATLAFPDIDAATLGREADELRAGAKILARAREAMDAAADALATRTAAVAKTTARAIAYARIYADAHPERAELATALAALEAGAPVAEPEIPVAKRRGRPRKQSADLFTEPSEAIEAS